MAAGGIALIVQPSRPRGRSAALDANQRSHFGISECRLADVEKMVYGNGSHAFETDAGHNRAICAAKLGEQNTVAKVNATRLNGYLRRLWTDFVSDSGEVFGNSED